MSISLAAGLGNPGRDYADTRHNLGWLVLDELAARQGLVWKAQPQFEAETARWDRPGKRSVLLVKPLTFMNGSGRAVGAVARYHRIEAADIVAIYDDVAIELGLVKVTVSGSAGGHNGVASLLEHVGDGFVRFRLGIGPKLPEQMDLKDFVLGKFTPDQFTLVKHTLKHYLNGLDLLLEGGVAQAMNTLNRREKNEPDQT